jgi:hypothetical protein
MSKPNIRSATTVYFYKQGGVHFQQAADEVVLKQDFDRQAELMVIGMVTALPAAITERICDLIDGDYEKMLKIGLFDPMNLVDTKRDKLTSAEAGAIKKLKGKVDPKELAHKYSVSYSNIMSIWAGRTWKKLPWAEDMDED